MASLHGTRRRRVGALLLAAWLTLLGPVAAVAQEFVPDPDPAAPSVDAVRPVELVQDDRLHGLAVWTEGLAELGSAAGDELLTPEELFAPLVRQQEQEEDGHSTRSIVFAVIALLIGLGLLLQAIGDAQAVS